VGAIILQLHAY